MAAHLLLWTFGWRDDAVARLTAVLAPGALVYRAVDSDEGYAYLAAPEDFARLDVAVRTAIPGAKLSQLALLVELAGASAGEAAPFHYVVETDVVEEHEADFNAWYDGEHMPGLAAVPGTVRAARYRDVAGYPRYYACYDLTSPGTLGSPAWLAVRATPWSDRVRPTFRNTRRTMFRRVA